MLRHIDIKNKSNSLLSADKKYNKKCNSMSNALDKATSRVDENVPVYT